ncbi:aldehyde dehydrogenase family protein [Kribbella sandramycini]|uniref:L-glutamate gamma-semialdehyde dehydrogenase n=1 Tax=Kribbella sandramycini TaxID=60450 RepID=A0A7Y4NZQ9_9ACTN|nr:aldehyde dehydrogenase family protein [Kribbella sandramycini]MBB6569927.1 1-pyrroline-5-carboxylate dehydrogenase [Kribbella sandramycini]NOL40249.1 aldehyde dehydrogenase family protein [Kribbella sandramycini]
MTKFRVTYATLSADNEDLHTAYEQGLATAQDWLGADLTGFVAGKPLGGQETFQITSPGDPALTLCSVHSATAADVDAAVAAAKDAVREWSGRPWQERVDILLRAADLISERSNELAALMSLEVGKNRLEALGDVEESADLIRYYCRQFSANDGFVQPMEQLSDAERTTSVLRPYGVWGVISPFNFPMALAAGPAGGALVAGNTVVLKPSPQGTFTAVKLYECLRDAGLPADVLHLLPGGDEVGRLLVAHPGVDGLTFTGSYQVGMEIYRSFPAPYPKPVVCEMGGKNPAIVSAKADLATAVAGIARSAFGFTGQKCSACSRVYVERAVYDEFLAGLAARAGELVTGDPTRRDVFVGPVIDAAAVARFQDAVAHAAEAGQVVAGGNVIDGNYVQPTVVTGLPAGDRLLTDELFVPFVAVQPVDSLDEAIELANATELGLTAGFFSADDAEVDDFLNRIEAGVVYVNRAAGATTGAWPGVQPFGGWKGSGSSGKAGGGLYYVQQFLREQSRTVVAR